jgi:hypothetical protein
MRERESPVESQSLTSADMSSSAQPRALAAMKHCSTRPPNGSGTRAAWASAWMIPRSLAISETGVAGSKSRARNRGRSRSNIAELPKDVPMTSSTVLRSAPSLTARAAASATAAVCTATSNWLVSLIACPAPTAPQSRTL